MAHNAYIRNGVGSGAWVTVVTDDEFELFDARQFQSINGDLGGTWAPSSPIVIGGSGIDIEGAFVVNAGTADAVIGGDLLRLSSDDVHVLYQLTTYGGVAFAGSGRHIEVTSSNEMHILSGGYFYADAGSHFTCNTIANLTNVDVSDVLSVGGSAPGGAKGRLVESYEYTSGNTDPAWTGLTVPRRVFIREVTTNVTWHLLTTYAVDGQIVEIFVDPNVAPNTITLQTNGNAALVPRGGQDYPLGATGNTWAYAYLMFEEGFGWKVLRLAQQSF